MRLEVHLLLGVSAQRLPDGHQTLVDSGQTLPTFLAPSLIVEQRSPAGTTLRVRSVYSAVAEAD
jgi:hypothetical protein